MDSVLYFTQIGESICSLPNHVTPTPCTEFSPISWGNTRIAHWAFIVKAFISSDVFPVAGQFVWRSTQDSQHFETPVLTAERDDEEALTCHAAVPSAGNTYHEKLRKESFQYLPRLSNLTVHVPGSLLQTRPRFSPSLMHCLLVAFHMTRT